MNKKMASPIAVKISSLKRSGFIRSSLLMSRPSFSSSLHVLAAAIRWFTEFSVSYLGE
jgi:hypothetical protein